MSDVQSLGANGTIASGQDLDTLTSFGSSTYTYTEYGGRTISFAGGGYIGGSYNDYESTSQSYTLSDSTSIALGANGTIASGTVASLTTQVYSDSQSFSEYGAENVPDPEGGPPFSGELTQTSVTTSYAYSVNRGTETLGALGTISGGGNSFSFNQSDYNSLWLSSPETDTASYSMNMAGTETYAPGGAISGGSDSFTWNQNAYDKTTIIYDQLAGTAAETNYEMLVTETVSDTMYDVGSDVLGASDSIVSNGDDYTIIDWQQVTSTIVDSGSSATSFYIYAVGIDDYTTTDAGSSTLSASGQSYGLDTVTFSESTSDNDYDTQSFGTTLYDWGTATDYYTNSDVSTITNSNGVTTSDDAFVMLDTHSVYGGDVGSSVSGTWSEGWTDDGTDVDVSSANGTSSPTGVALTFSNSDSSGDVGVSNESAVGEYTHNGGNNNSAINFTDGTYVSNAEGSDYNTYSSTTFDDSNWVTGTEYWMGMSYTVNVGNGTSQTLVTTVTGPPPSTETLTDVSGSYNSHTYGPYGSTGLVPPTGTAVTAGFGTANQLGYYEGGGVHNGSDNRGFDTGSGLASALGGQDVHGLEFTGPEEQAVIESGKVAIYDADGTVNPLEPPGTPWQSHPAAVGYVRGNQGSGTAAGTQGAAMDSGTRDGTPADELARLSNSGTEENPTSAQPAPTPRAEQAAGTPAASSASDAAANPANVGNSNGANAAAGGVRMPMAAVSAVRRTMGRREAAARREGGPVAPQLRRRGEGAQILY